MGQKINAKELYWQASEELLPGWRPEGGQYENRLAISLGYRSSGAWRLLLGIEQRLRFRPRALRQQIWGKIYYIYAIN
ncbi:hypothetical protein [Saprospira grandis]|uniref:hypothetical protein n=1 Tax=Saprospira grandis TaxID=1008 RepID=UPI0022DD6955|nr:hypothetical protein [Saprospira grandis]WBM74561.1 hypothetical protein OP864_16365 [Saprospira grandis]